MLYFYLLNFSNSIYIIDHFFLKNLMIISVTDSSGTLKILLSFAVGGLLGDIFLHLLPEAWKTGSLNKGNENAKRESLKTRLLYLNNADGKNRERQRAGNKLLSTGSSSLFAISWHRMATEALRDSLEYESHMITDELTAISTWTNFKFLFRL